MEDGRGPTFATWLALREPADAAARSLALVDELRTHLPRGGALVVHDLGCGTGSMARWLAGRLDGPQHWVMVDREARLLEDALASGPLLAADGTAVTVAARQVDLGRLSPQEVADASLITASALLDMMHGEELDRFVVTCAGVGCPVLVALSVTGRVDLDPPDRFDERVRAAFNDHQRRTVDGHRLLGPDAVGVAVESFRRLGREVLVRQSPWRLGPAHRTLVEQWFTGWLGAACEQDPTITADLGDYGRRRLAAAAAGRLRVTVHHEDLLVLPG